jgi:hypothetical protein
VIRLEGREHASFLDTPLERVHERRTSVSTSSGAIPCPTSWAVQLMLASTHRKRLTMKTTMIAKAAQQIQ